MCAVSFVTALVGPSLFPSDIDFWTLMPLPLPRRSIFVAKALAVFAFATLFIVGANVALTLPLALILADRSSGGQFAGSLVVQLATSVVASAFSVIAIAAIQGVVIACIPRSRFYSVAVVTQTALICLLVLSLPLIAHTPTAGPTLLQKPAWLMWVPPVWFLGLEQSMLGNRDPFFVRLALTAGIGCALALLVTLLGGIAAYRTFDCAVLKGSSTPLWTRHGPARFRIWPRHPAHEGVRLLISRTLRRSSMHQLAWLGMCAVGVALVSNALLRASGLRERWVVQAALETPFTLIAASVVGLRAALLLPTAIKAGWIFRLTETATTRRHQLDAVRRSLFVLGVLVPGAIAVPIEAVVIGADRALLLFPLVVVMGDIFLEIVILDWRRIPFTCTFLFARRPPAYTFGLVVGIFGWLVFIGASVLDMARTSAPAWLVVAIPLVAVLAALRWHRAQTWGSVPLEFEDYVPDGLDTITLN
jgi:hypothetical protein